MRILGPLGQGFVPVLTSGTWAVVFLGEPWGPAYLSVVLVMAAVAVTLTRPTLGALLLGAASFAALAAGCRYGSLELICGIAVVLGWIGRYERSLVPGVLGLALAAAPTAFRDGFEVRKLAVCLVVFGSAWLFGRIARHRALAADLAVEEAERLAATDPLALAQPTAAAERRQVAGEAAANLRSAVHDMITTIDEVLDDGTPDLPRVRRVRERGTRAVDDLRRLLVWLRAEPPPPPETTPVRANPLRLDLLLAAAAAVIGCLMLWQIDGWADTTWLPFAYAGVVTSLAIRRTAPLAAGVVLTLAVVPLVVDPPQDPEALLLIAIADGTVMWVLANREGRRNGAVVLGLAVVSLALGTRFGMDGVAFIAFVLLIATASGRAWGEPDRILLRAQARSDILRRQLERATAAAVHQERLRVARDLHDAAGHAVGVMLMQVNAAEANLARDPAKARIALQTARTAGEQARSAANPLLAGLSVDVAVDAGALRSELEALVAQWRASGMEVTATIDHAFVPDPDLAVTCYRVVQEALTNCARHAPGARVRVSVLRRGRHLLVEVQDSGATTAVSFPPSGGMGLSGLGERVTAGQGHFSASSTRGAGFRVSARLLLPQGLGD